MAGVYLQIIWETFPHLSPKQVLKTLVLGVGYSFIVGLAI